MPITPQVAGSFMPAGKTSRLSISATSANILLSTPCNSISTQQLQVVNTATVPCYVAFGTSNSVTASAGALGASTSDYPVQAGAAIVVTPPYGTSWVAVICESSATGEALLTPGSGI
jgi:hypothetical protein